MRGSDISVLDVLRLLVDFNCISILLSYYFEIVRKYGDSVLAEC